MNGHDHPELFSPPDDWRDDDDHGIELTDIECPFCGHAIAWTGTRLACFNCEVLWQDGAAVEYDRKQEAGR